MSIELDLAAIPHERQVRLPACYKGQKLGDYRIDLIVADAVVVEIKCVERLLPIHEAQLLTYLRLTRKRVGLLMNFHSHLLADGIKRMML
jgi:GxxExxY protein